MTRYQAGQYAAHCSHLQAQAKKNGMPYIKPPRPDENTLENLATIVNHSKRDVKTIKIRMKVVCEQMDTLTDSLDALAIENPDFREYQRIGDYLLGSLIEIQERIELI